MSDTTKDAAGAGDAEDTRPDGPPDTTDDNDRPVENPSG